MAVSRSDERDINHQSHSQLPLRQGTYACVYVCLFDVCRIRPLSLSLCQNKLPKPLFIAAEKRGKPLTDLFTLKSATICPVES